MFGLDRIEQTALAQALGGSLLRRAYQRSRFPQRLTIMQKSLAVASAS